MHRSRSGRRDVARCPSCPPHRPVLDSWRLSAPADRPGETSVLPVTSCEGEAPQRELPIRNWTRRSRRFVRTSRRCMQNWCATASSCGRVATCPAEYPVGIFRDQAVGRRVRRPDAENMILCDLEGHVVPGTAGSDRSPRATPPPTRTCIASFRGGWRRPHALAVRRGLGGPRQEIPCVITGMADEFGGPIPTGRSRSSAMTRSGEASSGPFAIIDRARAHAEPRSVHDRCERRDAVKAAIMCEDIARTVQLAMQLGPLIPIPQETIDQLYARYQNVYGQAGEDRRERGADDRRVRGDRAGRATLGIELGSTRIKACLRVGDEATVIARIPRLGEPVRRRSLDLLP